MMFAPVQPVQAERPRAGLTTLALSPEQEDTRWVDGMAWRPERCTSVRSYDACATGDVSEVQAVALTGGPTGGTFTLTYAGQTTAGIAYDAAAAAVQAALEALSNVAVGDVSVTGGPGPGTAWVVTFRKGLGNVVQLAGSGAGLTGGVTPAVSVSTTTSGFNMFGAEYGPGQSGVVYYRPLVARVEDECYARGSNQADDLARVRRQLEGVTSWVVARELWTGEGSDANPYSVPGEAGTFTNARLAGGAAVNQVAGVHEPLSALGELEYAARGVQGSLGMDVWLHVPISLLPHLDAGIVRDGSGLFTKTGARVVADAGYTGSDPDNAMQAGALWMYATGPVQVRLTPVQTLQDVDHSTNVVHTRAERVYAATFDPCSLFGIAADLPPTT